MTDYYFIASLPTLDLEEGALPSYEAFLQSAERLKASDRAELRRLIEGGAERGQYAFSRAWASVERALRRALARRRAVAQHTDPSPWMRPEGEYDGDAEHIAETAMTTVDPLARERLLDRWRWRRIEEMSGHDPFDDRIMFAYALKLRLAERWRRMTTEAGQKTFEELVAGPNTA